MKNNNKPTVGINMGSKSDWEIMKNCCDTLKSFKIDIDVRVISAHRTPKRLHEFLKEAEKKKNGSNNCCCRHVCSLSRCYSVINNFASSWSPNGK